MHEKYALSNHNNHLPEHVSFNGLFKLENDSMNFGVNTTTVLRELFTYSAIYFKRRKKNTFTS